MNGIFLYFQKPTASQDILFSFQFQKVIRKQ